MSSKRPISHPPDTVTSAQVARALRVGVSTVKRWVDLGILPARLTPGGHRQLLVRDVVRLVREGKLPQADLSDLVSPGTPADAGDAPELLKKLEGAVDAGDAELIRALVLGAYRGGRSVESLADDAIAPALRRVGHDWAKGRGSILREHRVTLAFVSALHELGPGQDAGSGGCRPLALGGAPEGDHYILPTLLARMALADSGWDAVNAGPNTPLSELAAAMDELKPRLLWLSVSHVADPDRFVEDYGRLYQAAEAQRIPIAIGGQALTAEIRARLKYTTFGDGFGQLVAFARTLHPAPQVPKRGRPPGRPKS